MDEQPLHQKEPQRPKKKTCTGFLCYKICVIFYGFIFLLVGLFMLAIGIWVNSVKADYESIDKALVSPTTIAIVLGVFTILLALLGIFGALKEHVICLKIFLAVIIIVFIVQIIIGVLAFVYRERIVNVAAGEVMFAVHRYGSHDRITATVDKLQSRFDCCGVAGPSDWNQNELYSCKADNEDRDTYCSVPESCCFLKEEGRNCGEGIRKNATSNSQYKARGISIKGCKLHFMSWIERHLDAIGATALALAIPQILGIYLVYTYMIKVEDRRYLFKYRKRLGINN